MNSDLLIYVTRPWIAFAAVFLVLFILSYLGFLLGSLVKNQSSEGNAFYLSDAVPTTIFGVLALILGFTFSMTVSRFEQRRQLVVAEANAIGTAYLRAGLLRPPRGAELEGLIREYLNARIEYYRGPANGAGLREIEARLAGLQKEIWMRAASAVEANRGVIESITVSSLNSMFDIQNERNVALRKTLPLTIYWSILFISGTALMAFNFARAERNERGQWQATILVFMISLVIYLILDIERPRSGTIQIDQDVMTDLRDSLAR